VCDTVNHRLQVLDRDGNFLRAIPVPGWNGPVEPHAEVDGDGTIYVSDPTAGAVLVMDGEGRVRERRVEDDAGNKLVVPTGLAIDRKNRILYVVNSGNNSISKTKLAGRKGD
jgi:sugar lactone lactonase YvrE